MFFPHGNCPDDNLQFCGCVIDERTLLTPSQRRGPRFCWSRILSEHSTRGTTSVSVPPSWAWPLNFEGGEGSGRERAFLITESLVSAQKKRLQSSDYLKKWGCTGNQINVVCFSLIIGTVRLTNTRRPFSANCRASSCCENSTCA